MPTHPLYPLQNREERLAIGKLFIELTRKFRRSIETVRGERDIKSKIVDGELLLVCTAAIVGHAENRPMTAMSIANYVELPRTTVSRKLKELVGYGMLERHGRAFLLSPRWALHSDMAVSGYLSVFEAAAKALESTAMRHRPKRTHIALSHRLHTSK
jgi:hypothetical protein